MWSRILNEAVGPLMKNMVSLSLYSIINGSSFKDIRVIIR